MIGFGSQSVSGLMMAQFDMNVSMFEVMWTSAFQGFGNSFLWAPLTVIAFGTLPTAKLGEATAIFHLIRNLGSAIVISVCVGVVIHATGVNTAFFPSISRSSTKPSRSPRLAGMDIGDDNRPCAIER